MNFKLIINVMIPYYYQPWETSFLVKAQPTASYLSLIQKKSQTSNGFFGADTKVSEENKNSTDLFVGYHLRSL